MKGSRAHEVVEAVLRDARQADSLVICVGAGLSRMAGVPVPELAGLARGAVAGAVVAAGQLAASARGPTSAHIAIAGLTPRAIVTTNYDTLVERALASTGRPHVVVTSRRDAPPESIEGVPIIKLHGSLDHPDTLVLHRRDYGDQWQNDWWLRNLFATSLVLAVGFRLGDDALGEVYEDFGAGAGAQQWVIIGTEPDPVAAGLWKSRGVAVHYMDAADLPGFFDALRTRADVSTMPAPPVDAGRVLLISGQSHPLRDRVLALLTGLGVPVARLEDYPAAGHTLLERFERLVEASTAAVVILDDDLRETRDGPTVRPNAIYELGFLMGRLGRERVLAVTRRGVAIPSDLAGLRVLLVDDVELGVDERIIHELRQWAAAAALPVD